MEALTGLYSVVDVAWLLDDNESNIIRVGKVHKPT
jgi:hypothetical protein